MSKDRAIDDEQKYDHCQFAAHGDPSLELHCRQTAKKTLQDASSKSGIKYEVRFEEGKEVTR
jgi:hypothetical protein